MKLTLKSADNSRGFTLIEIIAVLVIIGVVSAIVISRGFSTSIYNLESEADKLRTNLRYAQARAMSSSKGWGITISPPSYFLFNSDNVATPLALPGEDETTVTLSGFTLTTTQTYVSFDSFGRPYNVQDPYAGATPQSTSGTITLTLDGQTETITITQNTGFIP